MLCHDFTYCWEAKALSVTPMPDSTVCNAFEEQRRTTCSTSRAVLGPLHEMDACTYVYEFTCTCIRMYKHTVLANAFVICAHACVLYVQYNTDLHSLPKTHTYSIHVHPSCGSRLKARSWSSRLVFATLRKTL